MDDAEIRRRLGQARVARLATVGANGRPHLVPICFALAGDDLVFAVDDKLKRSTDLQRLRNIAIQPAVAVLIDHYEEDWTRLWWVRADGLARVLDGGEETDHAIDLLVTRYEQYRTRRPKGPAVSIHIERRSGWSSTKSQ